MRKEDLNIPDSEVTLNTYWWKILQHLSNSIHITNQPRLTSCLPFNFVSPLSLCLDIFCIFVILYSLSHMLGIYLCKRSLHHSMIKIVACSLTSVSLTIKREYFFLYLLHVKIYLAIYKTVRFYESEDLFSSLLE